MEALVKSLFYGLAVLVLVAGIGLLMAFPIMWCWNYAVVGI